MLKKLLLVSFILVIYLVSCITIYTKYSKSFKSKITMDTKISKVVDSEYIGYIYIPKINLKKNLFSINSNKNNIEYNVEVLKETIFPDGNNSIVFLAAHSGTGSNAYFNNLKYLSSNDEVILSYNNTIYKYIVIDKKEVLKNGYITGNRINSDEIILTTCSDSKGKQLIIRGILKK